MDLSAIRITGRIPPAQSLRLACDPHADKSSADYREAAAYVRANTLQEMYDPLPEWVRDRARSKGDAFANASVENGPGFVRVKNVDVYGIGMGKHTTLSGEVDFDPASQEVRGAHFDLARAPQSGADAWLPAFRQHVDMSQTTDRKTIAATEDSASGHREEKLVFNFKNHYEEYQGFQIAPGSTQAQPLVGG